MVNVYINQVRELTDILVQEVEAQGGKAFVACTPVISDGCVRCGRAGGRAGTRVRFFF